MKVTVINCWPRSGGTALNHSLVTRVIDPIFSECNLGFPSPDVKHSLVWQYSNWYKPCDAKSDLDLLYQLEKDGVANVIIRDFNYASFVPRTYNNYQPSNRLDTLAIVRERFDTDTFALVRNAEDIWMSMNNSPVPFMDIWFEGYLRYVQQLVAQEVQIRKYEDYCQDNDKFVDSLVFDYGWMRRPNALERSESLLGDIDPLNGSRNMFSSNVVQPERRKMTDIEVELIRNSKVSEANTILGY